MNHSDTDITKICSRCGEEKPLTSFYRRAKAKDGRSGVCSECECRRSRELRKENPEPKRRAEREYRHRNKDKCLARQRDWYERNKKQRAITRKRYWKENLGRCRALVSRWGKNNRHRRREARARRRSTERQAIPVWASLEKIEYLYNLAHQRSIETGIEHHVDHIVPLISPKVCGLHCNDNLQVIPASINVKKGNHHWPDMPNEII